MPSTIKLWIAERQHIIICMTFFLVASIGCYRKRKDETSVEKSSIFLPDSSQYAILPVAHARWILGDAQQAILNEKEILVIEYALRRSVKVYNDGRGAFLIDLTKYRRTIFPWHPGLGRAKGLYQMHS